MEDNDGRLTPSPIVELNRAVAVTMAEGAAAGLAIVDELASRGDLAGSHLLPSTRGELLARMGRRDEARAALEAALRMCRGEADRAVLELKLVDLADPVRD